MLSDAKLAAPLSAARAIVPCRDVRIGRLLGRRSTWHVLSDEMDAPLMPRPDTVFYVDPSGGHEAAPAQRTKVEPSGGDTPELG